MLKKIYNDFKDVFITLLIIILSNCIVNSIIYNYHTYGLGEVILSLIIGIPVFIGLIILSELIRNKFKKGE